MKAPLKDIQSKKKKKSASLLLVKSAYNPQTEAKGNRQIT